MSSTPKFSEAQPAPPQTPFAKKGAMGRVNADNLFKFNKHLKTAALQEKGYWEVNKNAHPINRWSYLRWEKQVRQESMFLDRANNLPIDQKFRFKKHVMAATNLKFFVPLAVIGYLIFSYARYKVFGVTAADGSTGIARYIQLLPRAPVN